MKKKPAAKIFAVFMAAALAAGMAFSLAGCGSGSDGKSAYEIWKEYHPESAMTEEEWLESLKGPSGEQGDPGVGWTVGRGAPAEAGKKGELYLDRERLDVYYYGEEGWEYLANLKGEEPIDLGSYAFNEEDYVVVTWLGEGEEDPTKLYEITITSEEDVSFFVVQTALTENSDLELASSYFDTFNSKIRDEKKGITTNTAVLYPYWITPKKGAEQPYTMAIARKQNEARPTEIHVQMREYDPQKQVLRADGEWHTVPLLQDSLKHTAYPLAMTVDPALRGKRVRATALALIPKNAEELSKKISIYRSFAAYNGNDLSGTPLKSRSTFPKIVFPDGENYMNLFFEVPEYCTEISFTGSTMGSYRVIDLEASLINVSPANIGYLTQVKIEEVEPIREKKMKDEGGSGTQEDPFTPANLEGIWEIEIPADSTVYIGTEITEDNMIFRFINGDYDGLMITSDFKTSRGQSYSPPLGMEAGTQVLLYPLKGSAGIEITNREDEAITITLTIERLH